MANFHKDFGVVVSYNTTTCRASLLLAGGRRESVHLMSWRGFNIPAPGDCASVLYVDGRMLDASPIQGDLKPDEAEVLAQARLVIQQERDGTLIVLDRDRAEARAPEEQAIAALARMEGLDDYYAAGVLDVLTGIYREHAAEVTAHRTLLRRLLATLPKCDHPTCESPALKAYRRGEGRWCDVHAAPDTPDYPRAQAVRDATKVLRNKSAAPKAK